MTVSSLIRSRALLRNGRGQTTRRDRVLPSSLARQEKPALGTLWQKAQADS